MRRIICWLGLHRRSRSRARYDRDGALRSRCRQCGIRMVMTAQNRWVVERGPTYN